MKIGRIRKLPAQALVGICLAGMGVAEALAVPITADYLIAEQIHRDYYYKYEYSVNNTAGQYNFEQYWSTINFNGRILAPTNLSGSLFEIDFVSGGVDKSRSVVLPSDNACPSSSTVRCYNYQDYSSGFYLHVREYLIDNLTTISISNYYNKAEYFNGSGTYDYVNGQMDIYGDASSFPLFGNDLGLSITINALSGEILQGDFLANISDYSYSSISPWTCSDNQIYCNEESDVRSGKSFAGVPTSIVIAPIPEPTVLSLLGLGLLGLGWSRTRRAG